MHKGGLAQSSKMYSLKSDMSSLIWVSTPRISILVGYVAHVAVIPQVSYSLCRVLVVSVTIAP